MPLERKQNVAVVLMPLEIVWRNPQAVVQTHLRLREASNPYYGWAEQGRRIRGRHANWDTEHGRDFCWLLE
jgi:hypothetical protein